MSLLRIYTYGDPILRKKATPIETVDEEIRQLSRDMIETMYEAEGVGLAAPQIGRSIRMLIADASHHDGVGGPRAFINPVILESWDEWSFDEGCLSVPGLSAELIRPEAIRLRFQDEQGEERIEEFHQLWARVLLHEIDHLDGKLFIDYLSPMRRALILKKLRALEKDSKTGVSL